MTFKARRFGHVLLSLCMLLGLVNWSAAQDVVAPYERAWGSAYRPRRPPAGATVLSQHRYGNAPADWIKRWNEIAINASGLDHTPPAPGETRNYHEQLGPGRSSRAVADYVMRNVFAPVRGRR